MSGFKPQGRRSIPDELLSFGRHIVYSEGTKNEPYYAESIKKEIADKYNCAPNLIEIINGNSDLSYSTICLITKKILKIELKTERK